MNLTTEMAEWLALGDHQELLLIDYMKLCMFKFQLTPEQAGDILGQWLKAVYSGETV